MHTDPQSLVDVWSRDIYGAPSGTRTPVFAVRERNSVVRLKAALDRARPQRRPSFHRSAYALDVLRAEVLKIEEVAEKLVRAVSDDDGVRLGNAL